MAAAALIRRQPVIKTIPSNKLLAPRATAEVEEIEGKRPDVFGHSSGRLS